MLADKGKTHLTHLTHFIFKADAIERRLIPLLFDQIREHIQPTIRRQCILRLTPEALYAWNPLIFSLPDSDKAERLSYYLRTMLYIELASPPPTQETYEALHAAKLLVRNKWGTSNAQNLLHVPNTPEEAYSEYMAYEDHLFEISTSPTINEEHHNSMKRILIVGDSFVEGVGDQEKGGWASRLAQIDGMAVTFDGVGGRTAQDVDLLKDCLPSGFDLAILQIGINDSRFRNSLGEAEVPLKQFKELIDRIAATLKTRAHRVAVMGLTRVDESLTDPYKPDKSYRNRMIDTYDACLREGASNGIYDYIPVPSLIDGKNLLSDGLHPSPNGHQLLLEAALLYIDAHSLPIDHA